jgi:hypothetical protein
MFSAVILEQLSIQFLHLLSSSTTFSRLCQLKNPLNGVTMQHLNLLMRLHNEIYNLLNNS